jgi:hypothetical protein
MKNESSELSTAGKVIRLGALLLLAGIAGTLYFCFGFGTAVNAYPGTDVNNFGLLDDRLIGVLASLATALGGLLIILFASLISKLDRPIQITVTPEPAKTDSTPQTNDPLVEKQIARFKAAREK